MLPIVIVWLSPSTIFCPHQTGPVWGGVCEANKRSAGDGWCENPFVFIRSHLSTLSAQSVSNPIYVVIEKYFDSKILKMGFSVFVRVFLPCV